MRRTTALFLFIAATIGLFAAGDPSSTAQEKKAQKKKVEVVPPDEATLKQIAEKTAALRKAVEALNAKETKDGLAAGESYPIGPDVEVFLKAAEWIVRHGEWLTNDSGKQTLRVLDIGLERSKHAAAGKSPWRAVTGKWVTLGYHSQVDGSVQPYAVLLPEGYGGSGEEKRYRLETVLHGRDGTLTEVKFLSSHEGKAAPKGLDHVQLEVYGRGNNAYRWAGETDVFEAIATANLAVLSNHQAFGFGWTRRGYVGGRNVLRGFSMGGAGTWHIGLHHPSDFAAISPGAGFTTTHGYVAGLPKDLPPHVEKCLRIYDAVNYGENAMMVPVVAYSGEKDPQKKAADNIENALKGFKEPVKFTHLVAPGLEHQMPAEWQAKAEDEYRKYTDKPRDPSRVRFVTYTPKYGRCHRVNVVALESMYERAVVDASVKDGTLTVTTSNIRLLDLDGIEPDYLIGATVDGQKPELLRGPRMGKFLRLEKAVGKWREYAPKGHVIAKQNHLCGPIDDAFTSAFAVIGSTDGGWHPAPVTAAAARQREFARLWDKYFRGTLPTPAKLSPGWRESTTLVLFGDPQSNPEIAKVLPKLPITWTKDELVVNGVKYDPKTHLPVLIYPVENAVRMPTYVVLNSGHTFGEADLKGTNALLYPRLGDWAVIKPMPTDKDPAAFEVVAAGLFDENWQFPKK